MTAPAIAMPTGRAHGARAKYVFEKCRCMPCRLANTRYQTLRYARTQVPWRIRCVGTGRLWLVQRSEDRVIDLRTLDRAAAVARCAELNAAWKATVVHDPLWASPGTVTAVRRHLAKLAAKGVSMNRVAAVTGLSRTRLLEIKLQRSYSRDRPQRRRLRQETAERILAVQMLVTPAAGARVPAEPTWERINRLLARGVTRTAIARAMGSGAKTPALQIRRTSVLQRTADEVRAVCARLGGGNG